MNFSYHAVCKFHAVFSVCMDTSVFLYHIIEFLNLICSKSWQRTVSKVGFYLVFYKWFICRQRSLANSEDHKFVDPLIEPFADCHLCTVWWNSWQSTVKTIFALLWRMGRKLRFKTKLWLQNLWQFNSVSIQSMPSENAESYIINRKSLTAFNCFFAN